MSSNGSGYLSKPGSLHMARRPKNVEKGRFEKFNNSFQQTIGKGVKMLSLNAVGVLFPAIPLAIVALNFRYTSLAGLMRELHAQLDKKLLKAAQKQVLCDELAIMARRLSLVKYSLFFLGLSFVVNTATLFALLNQGERISIFFMNATIALLLIGLCFFCIETVLSTKALRMHLSEAETQNEQTSRVKIL